MTPKKKAEAEFAEGGLVPGDAPSITLIAGEYILPKAGAGPVSLHGLSADAAVAMLRYLKSTADGPVTIEAPIGAPADAAVVDDHAFAGEQVGAAWHFHPTSLEMACRVAGWASVHAVGEGERPFLEQLEKPHGDVMRWVLS